MADTGPFASAGLGMFGSEKKYMSGGGDGGEFLGGVLKFMGVGDDTVKQVQDFAKNPFASAPTGPGYGALANSGPLISNEGIEKGGGFNPAGVAPSPEQFTGQGIQFNNPAAPVAPTFAAPTWNADAERQKNSQIVNNLVPRNIQ